MTLLLTVTERVDTFPLKPILEQPHVPRNAAGGRVVLVAVLALTASSMPVFVLGVAAVLIRQDLGFGQGGLGLAAGAFFAALSVASIPGGMLADRAGPRRALQIAIVSTSVSTAGLALQASSLAWLIVWLTLAGASAGLTLAAASLALVRGVEQRGGMAFGIQQSAVPAASLIAGVAFPIVAVTVGWRWTIALGLTLVPLVAALLPSDGYFNPPQTQTSTTIPTATPVAGLLAYAVAAGLGTAAAISTSAFFVESAVYRDVSASSAALSFGGASAVCVGVRLYCGWRADAGGRGLTIVTALLLAAGVGHVVLATATHLPLLLFGVLLAYGIGYGWPGLMLHGIAGRNPHAPGVAIGTVNAGGGLGAAIGPIAFGLLASQLSHHVAWAVMAGLTFLSALILFSATRSPNGHG